MPRLAFEWSSQSPHDTIVIFYENRRMPQGTRLTELEQGKILAYKDSGMSIHQIAKKISRFEKSYFKLFWGIQTATYLRKTWNTKKNFKES